jgi:hypothetical protein
MKLLNRMAIAVLAVALPLSSLGVTHKVVRNYKEKAPKHPHQSVEKHKSGHGKEFKSAVKERAKRGKELRQKSAGDEFGVHKVK